MSATDATGPVPGDRGAEAQSAVDEREALIERIRRRAYELSLSAESGTDAENWLRAEQAILHETRLDETTRQKELEDAREAESSALLSAQARAFGHP